MVQVAIAGNHPVVREGLKSILSRTPDVRVCGESANLLELLQGSSIAGCEVLVIDLTVSSFDEEFELLLWIRQRRPGLPILILSGLAEHHFGACVLRAGASGCLDKRCPPEELVLAVRKLARGEKYLSSEVAEVMDRLQRADRRPPHEALSLRERQVFLHLASGKTPTRIAGIIMLSVKTVSTYRTRILEKMNMKTTAELMHYAIQNRLVEKFHSVETLQPALNG
jgi:two-component system, NarL family, invasion response regulator UvrY